MSSVAFGQAANTPFSTFGIGEHYGNSLIQNQGMGGTGVSQPQFWSVNNQNPALLVYNYYTSFQAGALLESRKISSDTVRQKGSNGNLSYLVVAFPAMRGRWTTSFGLTPYTNINYRIIYGEKVYDNQSGDAVDTVSVIEQGDGGLSQFYWANGVRINKEFAVGIKAAYLFGSTNRDYSNLLDADYSLSGSFPYVAGIKEQTYIKDFMFTLGLSYSKDSLGRKKDLRLSAGATYSFSSDLKASKTTIFQRRSPSGIPIIADTLVTYRGNVSVPEAFTIGVSISKGARWSVGTEFTVQNWSKFSSINEEDEGLDNSWKIAAGGDFTPNPLANGYLKRITYRAGFSYEKNPFLINGNEVKDIGINFGFSCPTGFSSLDFGARIGKRGDKSQTILEESYFKIYFGITFNDRWFIRRRFD